MSLQELQQQQELSTSYSEWKKAKLNFTDAQATLESRKQELIAQPLYSEQVSEEERKEIEGTSQDINYKGDHK